MMSGIKGEDIKLKSHLPRCQFANFIKTRASSGTQMTQSRWVWPTWQSSGPVGLDLLEQKPRGCNSSRNGHGQLVSGEGIRFQRSEISRSQIRHLVSCPPLTLHLHFAEAPREASTPLRIGHVVVGVVRQSEPPLVRAVALLAAARHQPRRVAPVGRGRLRQGQTRHHESMIHDPLILKGLEYKNCCHFSLFMSLLLISVYRMVVVVEKVFLMFVTCPAASL